DEHRRAGLRPPDRVERAVLPRLACEPDLVRKRLDERLHLLRQVPGDDGDPRDARGRELVQERGDDCLAVDRENRLRPAVGDRPQAVPAAGGDHDCFYRRRCSASSSTAAATACFDAFGSVRSPARVTSTTSLSAESKPMSERETSL